MKCVLLTPWISPHQLPLAEAIVKLIGGGNFVYFYLEPPPPNHVLWGWDKLGKEKWCRLGCIDDKVLLDCEVLLSGVRNVSLFKARAKLGKQTCYMSERWFKPPIGMFRLLHPKYLLMSWRLVKLMRQTPSFTYLPIGIHAARDMARLSGLFAGDLKCLFHRPELDFEKKPGGKIWLKNDGDGKRYCLDKMRMWGYFVEPSQLPHAQLLHSPTSHSSTLKVLWVGRLLKLKRVDTIIRAVGELAKSQFPSNANSNSNFHIQLDIYGAGPEERRLKKMASKYGDCIIFHPPVSVVEVRDLMRSHDLYVLASNGYEGWGAVVSEALEEGMNVIGTYEAGSSATILSTDKLFHAGDWRCLMKKLSSQCLEKSTAGEFLWSANAAAKLFGGISNG